MRSRQLPWVLISCLLLILSAPNAVAEPTSIVFTAARTYLSEAWIHGGERFPSGAKLFVRDKKGQHELFREFAASADANISFDATHILFAGKRHATDRWQIWEAPLNGGEPRQITHCKEDCVTPFFLPGGNFVFAERKNRQFVIETASLDAVRSEKSGARSPSSGSPVPLTFIPGSALPTDILRDGRILFEATYPLGEGTKSELYTVYSDGSGVESYRCDHGADRHSGKQAQDGDILFVSANSLQRFTSPLAHADALNAPKGQFGGDVTQLPSGDWLFAWRAHAAEPFRLMTWKPGSATLSPFAHEPGLNLVQPVVVAEGAVPNRHPSGLHDWSNANILCLNAYTSKYEFAPGSIATVNLYARGTSGKPKLLGSSPVESDGSFFLHVPSDQPIRFELLDKSGKTLKREVGWFWMRRGEQRVCVGCHAGPDRAPNNEVPKVLLKSTDPVDLTLFPAHATRTGGH